MKILVTNISEVEHDLRKVCGVVLLLGEDVWITVPDDYVLPYGVMAKKIEDQVTKKVTDLVSTQLLTTGVVQPKELRDSIVNTSLTSLTAKVAK
jgi:hypothetical protein